MSGERTRSQLARLLERHGVRYAWVGTWPGAPRLLGHADPDPGELPDGKPAWVGRIHEKLWDEILPLKKGVSWDRYQMAMAGYMFAACQHEANVREEIDAQMVSALRQQAAGLGGKVMEPGFAYGVECRQREAGLTPSARTETWQICKALLVNWRQVHRLTRRGATSKEIGDYVTRVAVMGNGMTYHAYFVKHPPPTSGSVRLPSGDVVSTSTKEGRARAKQLSGRGKFLKFFQKICGDLGVPLPTGRPRRNAAPVPVPRRLVDRNLGR